MAARNMQLYNAMLAYVLTNLNLKSESIQNLKKGSVILKLGSHVDDYYLAFSLSIFLTFQAYIVGSFFLNLNFALYNIKIYIIITDSASPTYSVTSLMHVQYFFGLCLSAFCVHELMYYLEAGMVIINVSMIYFHCFWQLSLTAGEDVEIEYEVDGWFYVSLQDLYLYFI